jgi:hypothetical protein
MYNKIFTLHSLVLAMGKQVSAGGSVSVIRQNSEICGPPTNTAGVAEWQVPQNILVAQTTL